MYILFVYCCLYVIHNTPHHECMQNILCNMYSVYDHFEWVMNHGSYEKVTQNLTCTNHAFSKIIMHHT